MNTITTYPNRREGAHLLKIAFWIGMVALFLLLSRVAPTAEAAVRGSTIPPLPTVLVGPISDTFDSVWVVAGVTVEITEGTRINERMNSAHTDRWARVEGVPNGSNGLIASRIKVLPPHPFIRIQGKLDMLSEGSLQVSGILVSRNDSTIISGAVTQGARVGVKAYLDEGILIALQVHPMGAPQDDDDDAEIPAADKIELIGQVMERPDGGVAGPWKISAILVSVTDATEIKEQVGAPIRGAWVKIEGRATGDGGILALEMKTTETRDYHKLEGVLGALSSSEIVVSGITIAVDPAVQIEGTPSAGQRVEVRARLDGDDLYVTHVRVRKAADQEGKSWHIVGSIRALPTDGLIGEWQIGGHKVMVTDAMLIDEHKGSISLGAQVRAEVLKTGGTLTALSIVVLRADNGNHNRFVELTGKVESLPTDTLLGEWKVSGRTVIVSQHTTIKGDPSKIAEEVLVEIKGYARTDGVIDARKIEVKEEEEGDRIKFEGKIEQLPRQGMQGSWVVSGRDVKVMPQTRIEGSVAVGVDVEVEGRQPKQGPIRAEKIKVIDAP